VHQKVAFDFSLLSQSLPAVSPCLRPGLAGGLLCHLLVVKDRGQGSALVVH